MDAVSKSIDIAEQEIRRYLAQRPEAADTFEGIHNFWVRWPAPESPDITQAALARLEQNGFVSRVSVAGREIWRRRAS